MRISRSECLAFRDWNGKAQKPNVESIGVGIPEEYLLAHLPPISLYACAFAFATHLECPLMQQQTERQTDIAYRDFWVQNQIQRSSQVSLCPHHIVMTHPIQEKTSDHHWIDLHWNRYRKRHVQLRKVTATAIHDWTLDSSYRFFAHLNILSSSTGGGFHAASVLSLAATAKMQRFISISVPWPGTFAYSTESWVWSMYACRPDGWRKVWSLDKCEIKMLRYVAHRIDKYILIW